MELHRLERHASLAFLVPLLKSQYMLSPLSIQACFFFGCCIAVFSHDSSPLETSEDQSSLPSSTSTCMRAVRSNRSSLRLCLWRWFDSHNPNLIRSPSDITQSFLRGILQCPFSLQQSSITSNKVFHRLSHLCVYSSSQDVRNFSSST